MASKSRKPTLVLFVRHGQTPTTGAVLPGRAPGLHLSDRGREQAEQAAARIAALGPKRIAAVYASPMERARETAAPIARAVGRRVRVLQTLNECDFGKWTGRRLSDLRRRRDWRQVQRSPSSFRFPGGESFAEMQTRMNSAVQSLVARHPGTTVVAVSHADTIKAAVSHASGAHLDMFQRIVVSPCSITAILYSDDGPLVLAVNSTSELKALVPS
ncbi:MAG: MSMEG_4193 family putative phosphomutase [Acidimicrobiia bacterium]|nr:MSMEG_4193 family putative phosphomutase [Acidimicrobiia bacterium]MYG57255.1 MSMEG_4193 family putative phosphomutase [Acidimicrobiia bacterium]MYJ32357.1 MSMEG_4193 family putative phosphomutase [Acidimicrobiia bacterium]